MENYRISQDGTVYYVTFTITQWLPLFVREQPCKILTDSLNYCIRNKGLLVNAYVLMPTHLHAIVADRKADSVQLSQALDEFRKFTGRNLADWCDKHAPEAFRRVLREEAPDDRTRRLWQPSRHPESVYSNEFMNTKVDYVHSNPVRAGLVRYAEHWRFSSAGYYASGGTEDCDVNITCLEW